MSVDSLIELKNLIEDYPYCQTAQILYLLNLKRLEEDTFDMRLPYTAICANNRMKLKCVVDKVDEILEKETKRSENSHHEIKHQETIGNRIPRTVKKTNQPISIGRYGNKTISELLNLQDKIETVLPAVPSVTQSQAEEDLLLEQLRQEALAKVNERLLEIHGTEAIETNLSKPPKQKQKVNPQTLIDKVIATNPRISKVDSSDIRLNKMSHWKNKEERSLSEDSDLVSESLAQLYIAQGAPDKAREVYSLLSKKYPDKAGYFAQLSKNTQTAKTAKAKTKSKTAKTTKTTKTSKTRKSPKL